MKRAAKFFAVKLKYNLGPDYESFAGIIRDKN